MAAVIEPARPIDRWLLAQGAPEQALEHLLRAAHRAGFTVIPRTAERWQFRAFELEHREAPRGALRLAIAVHRYPGPCEFTVTELELERQEGPRKLADRIALLLDDNIAWQRARLGPAEREQLAAGERMHELPVIAHLRPESRWQDLGIAMCRALAIDLRYCLAAAAEPGATEGVHQLRVTTRRLREMLRVFADVLPADQTHEIRDHLKRLAGALGAVRDFDIRLARLPRRCADDAVPDTIDRYADALARARQRSHARLMTVVDASEVTYLPSALAQLLGSAQGLDAPDTIDTRTETLLKSKISTVRHSGEMALRSGKPRHLHALRIQVKRLRYALECIAPVTAETLGESLPMLATASASLQDLLGEHQDAHTAALGLRRWLDHATIGGAERRAVKRLLARERRAADVARHAFEHAWPTFAERSRARIMC